MQYSNKHLIEVNCGFQFPEETVAWDSTFFGQFYEKIKGLGFTSREERKGLQITFNGTPPDIQSTASQIEDQVIFKNTEKERAILIGRGRISFHCVGKYEGWDIFLSNFIIPFYEHYLSLGLGNGVRHCNVVYLNRFLKDQNDKLSDYFTIINSFKKDFGLEIFTAVQKIISNTDSNLIARLNSQVKDKRQTINLECGAVCSNEEYLKSNDWQSQANKVHKPINEFFESLITDKLRKEL